MIEIRTGRRDFLSASFLALATAASQRLAIASATDPSVVARKYDSVVFVTLSGGLSHIDTLDPKPNSPAEYRGEFSAIPTRSIGAHFSSLLPKLANCSDRFALLRSMSHSSNIHEQGQRYLLTGVENPRTDIPSLGAVTSFAFPSSGAIPHHVAIPGLESNAGELGQKYESYNLLGDTGYLLSLGPKLDSEPEMRSFNRRLALLETMEGNFPAKAGNALRIRSEAYQQAGAVFRSKELRVLSHLAEEPDSIRDLYGRTEFGDLLLYARRVLENDAKFVTVTLGGWDTHYDAFPTLKNLLPSLDHALAGFFTDLSQRGLDQKTLVVVASEFGRTPKINNIAGRDHWPAVSPVLLFGATARAGLVYGETDELGAEVNSDIFSPSDLAFTIMTGLGLTPNQLQLPPTNRVFLPKGRLIEGVFA